MGDWLTIGTLETADTEVVQVTSVASTPTLAIRGIGNDETSNTGFKFAHAAGAAVYETQNVAALVMVGPDAVGKVWSSLTGPNGKSGVKYADSVIPSRFQDFWWWQIVGYGRIRNWGMVRGEFPTAFESFGYAEALP